MIAKISGKLVSVHDTHVLLACDPFEYEILVPEFVRRSLQSQVGKKVSFHTMHYLEGNPSQGGRLTPRLVGFLSEIEREFFDLFCSVDGVGARKALRAMLRPVREVAAMIEAQDAKGLSTLPGVGPATSDRIIAKLRRKMPKFALLVSGADGPEANVPADVVQETYAVLCSLGHVEADARKLLDAALADKKKYKDVDALLQAIYQRSTNAVRG